MHVLLLVGGLAGWTVACSSARVHVAFGLGRWRVRAVRHAAPVCHTALSKWPWRQLARGVLLLWYGQGSTIRLLYGSNLDAAGAGTCSASHPACVRGHSLAGGRAGSYCVVSSAPNGMVVLQLDGRAQPRHAAQHVAHPSVCQCSGRVSYVPIMLHGFIATLHVAYCWHSALHPAWPRWPPFATPCNQRAGRTGSRPLAA